MHRLERNLRLATGLAIAGFVVPHFLNHALGVVSVDAMDRLRAALILLWWSPAGTVLLYGSLVTHFALALASLYRRTTLRMPAWEALQLALGLAVPPLLIGHVVGTRLSWELLGHQITYVRVIGVLWSDPWAAMRQSLLLLLVWGHLCFGLHYWLRIKAWYPRVQALLYALALLVPALALSGFVSAGFDVGSLISRLGGPAKFDLDLANMTAADRALLADWRKGLLLAFWVALGATLLARYLRPRMGAAYQIHHASGRVISAPVGRSLLEAVREAGLPHASVCGGRARCTTCRVRIGRGLESLAPPGPLEAAALARIEAEPNVRLACQTRPASDVRITPLVPAGTDPGLARRSGGVQGREQSVAAMFVDLRGSTALGESRLPYDVVFILNQFFAEMYQALEGAAEMQRRLDGLNASLASELPAPLRIGIGLHAGVAIVGTMGPPDAPIYSAIGDTINIAARFEGMSKYYRCTLVVSADTIRRAALPEPAAPRHSVRVRGRTERIDVYAVDDPRSLLRTPAVT